MKIYRTDKITPFKLAIRPNKGMGSTNEDG